MSIRRGSHQFFQLLTGTPPPPNPSCYKCLLQRPWDPATRAVLNHSILQAGIRRTDRRHCFHRQRVSQRRPLHSAPFWTPFPGPQDFHGCGLGWVSLFLLARDPCQLPQSLSAFMGHGNQRGSLEEMGVVSVGAEGGACSLS